VGRVDRSDEEAVLPNLIGDLRHLPALAPFLEFGGAGSVGKALKSGPISNRMVWAVIRWMPSLLVRSTPAIRLSSLCRSRWGALQAFFCLRFAFWVGWGSGPLDGARGQTRQIAL
jgi:hypothetical protein